MNENVFIDLYRLQYFVDARHYFADANLLLKLFGLSL